LENNGRRLANNVERGKPVEITVDGEPIQAYEGESLAVALMAAGRRAFRHTDPGGQPRGIFCGIGVCFDCVVTVDNLQHIRACITPVRQGMQVLTTVANTVRD
jgi:aerobic-type carbon monoxide dehydrogenase small subunit (CoxS/CutS family)